MSKYDVEIGELIQIDMFTGDTHLAIVVDKWYSNREFDPDLRGYVYKFMYLCDGTTVSFTDKILKAYMKSKVVCRLEEKDEKIL